MQLDCGPVHDRRTLTLNLPATPSHIGVFVSGGLDSAILYYLLLEENRRLGDIHTVIPLTIPRKEGSKHFAKLVVAHVQAAFWLPYTEPLSIGNTQLPEHLQVKSGIKQSYWLGFNEVYVGLIEQLPEHIIGWDKPVYAENSFYRIPLQNLQKCHIVDLIKHAKQEALFYITHACDQLELARCWQCNGCRERAWGFEQLALSDPSML